MSYLASTTAITRLILLAAILLAAMMLSFSSFLTAFAQDATETIEYAEDRTDEVVAYTASDPERQDIVWTLTGDDADDFDIDGGVLTFKSQPDFENGQGTGSDTNTYVVTVVASDGVNPVNRPLNVVVTNVDEPGTVVLGNRQPQLETALTATLSDPDGLVPTSVTATDIKWRWAISTSPNGPWTNIRRLRTLTEPAFVELTSTYPNTVTSIYMPHNDDVGHYLRATATYTDGHGANKSESAVSENRVVLNLVNDAPEFVYVEGDDIPGDNEVGEAIPDTDTEVEREVAENSPAGTNVGAPLMAIDDDGDTLTYELSGANAGSFDLDRQTGQIRVKAGTTLNREVADPTYMVTVTAKDPSDQGDGADTADQSRDTINVTITLTNVPEAPEITAGETSIDQNENIAAATSLATYTATDDEDDYDDPNDVSNGIVPLNWSLAGADSDMFELCDDASVATCDDITGTDDMVQLRFKESPNYEALSNTQKSNGLKLTVTVTDSDDMTDSRNVTVRVTNVNEAGTVTLSRVQPQVGTSISASLTDLDGTPSGITWRWATSTGETSPGNFIGGQTRSSYTPVAGDVGGYLWAFASYTDPQGSGKTATTTSPFVVKLKNTYCVTVDGTNPTTCISTRDGNMRPMFPDQDTQTTGDQRDRATRTIAENTGAGVDIELGVTGGLTGAVAAEPDDDNIVSADPGAPLSTTTGPGTAAVDNLTYTLEGTDARSFDIASTTGQLMTKAPLDFETKKSYSVRVRATDPTGLNATINVTINVTDVEEDPEITSGDAGIEIPENTPAAVVLSTYTATDDEDDYDDADDAGNEIVPLNWSLSGDDMEDFELSAATGATTRLMFMESPNYESPEDVQGTAYNVYNVTVTVTDSDGDTASREVTVTVTNVEEEGTVTLSAEQPQVDVALDAKLIDPDGEDDETPPLTLDNSAGSPDNLTAEAAWQWARSTSRTGGWTDIEDAGSSSYTATSTDVGYYLRATATYTDGHGASKSKSAVSAHPVQAGIYSNSAPVFVYVQGDEIPGVPYPDIDGTQGPDDIDGDSNIDEYAVGDAIPDVTPGDPTTSAGITRRVAENSPARTNVGPPVFARDIGRNGRQENLTYELVDPVEANTATDPEDFFTIDSATGQIRVKAGTMLDREGTTPTYSPTYTVTVLARDPFYTPATAAVTSDTIEVAIMVTDVPEAPEITAGDTATSTPESIAGTPARDVLATYTATDEEDDYDEPTDDTNEIVPLKWSLSGADSDMFELCDDDSAATCDDITGTDDMVQLRFKESPDYEALSNTQKSNGLKLTVTVTDSDNMTDSRNVTVRVTNVDEAGTVTLSRVQPQVGISISASLTDLDGTPSGVTWRWATSTSDTTPDPFIQGRTSSSYTPVAGDVASYLWAFASYTDPQGSGKTATTTQVATPSPYTVKAKNEYCATLNSGNTLCTSRRNGNVRPVFPDQDTGTTGIQNTHTTRSIGELTGGVSTPSGTDIGAVVAANDTLNLTATGGDVNTTISTTTATDLLTYTLEGTNASSFDIDVRTAQLETKAPLDFESKESYSVRVKATDPSGLSTTINVTINVTDVDEAPIVSKKSLAIAGGSRLDYPETQTDLQVASYSAAGPEGTRAWSLSGDDSADFSLTSDGTLSFRTQPDFEDPADSDTDNEYRVTVTATVEDLTDSLDVIVTVTNVDEDGTVELTYDNNQVRVGVAITAETPEDPDGGVTAVTWQWQRSSSGTGLWTAIGGARSASFTPVAGQRGQLPAGGCDLHGRARARQDGHERRDAIGSPCRGSRRHGRHRQPVSFKRSGEWQPSDRDTARR